MGSQGDNLNMDTGNMDLRLIEARETYREQFADNDWARFLIASYKIMESDECNIDIINKSGVKRDRLKATITFLKNKFSEVYPKATEFLSPKINNITKKELSLQLINFIKFSIPHNCLTCDQSYFPYIDNYALTEIRCFKCSLPAHSTCIKEDEIHLRRGIVFVCATCITSKVNSGAKRPSNDDHSSQPIKSNQTPSTNPSDDSLSESESSDNIDLFTTKKSKKKKTKPTDSEEEDQSSTKKLKKKKSKSSDSEGESNKSSNEKICRFYERGICRFGLSGNNKGKCKFSHPAICRKVINHGTRGKLGCKGQCDKWHPRLCYAALNKKECFNSSCTFWHIKGTKRSPDSQNDQEPKPKEEPKEPKENHFLGPMQSQMTLILQTQQEMLKQQMTQFMQQMKQEMRTLATLNHQQMKLPVPLLQQTPMLNLPTIPTPQ